MVASTCNFDAMGSDCGTQGQAALLKGADAPRPSWHSPAGLDPRHPGWETGAGGTAEPAGPRRPVYVGVKTTVDWLVALSLLVLTAPFVAFFAILVKLTSHGPAFYCQTRLGKGGR